MLMKRIVPIALLTTLVACAAPQSSQSTQIQMQTEQTAVSQPLNQKWKLIEFQSFGEQDLAQAVLDLSELPRAHATVGCNQMNFQVAVSPENAWQVKGIAMTRMYCEEVAALETAFAKSIQAAQNYRFENNRLILQNTSGEKMVFEVAQ